jgi:hypothetical protein
MPLKQIIRLSHVIKCKTTLVNIYKFYVIVHIHQNVSKNFIIYKKGTWVTYNITHHLKDNPIIILI